jgi:GNAT superfamily N-acetyltransferase
MGSVRGVTALTIRPATTDDDLESWRQVRIAVLPYERTATLDEMRALAGGRHQFQIAERDGVVVGSGTLAPSSLRGAGAIAPRVIPQFRRQGIGTTLLDHLLDLAKTHGYPIAACDTDDPASARFAESFGFVEVDRQVEQVRAIGPDEPMPTAPPGVSVISVAEQPELWTLAYNEIGREGLADMAVSAPMEVSLEEWASEWIADPAATFLALDATGGIIGTAGLLADGDVIERAEHGFTTVRRDWRGKGIASLLKRRTLHWASQHGLTEVYTWTQRGNADMRQLNEHLGFTTRTESIRFEKLLG